MTGRGLGDCAGYSEVENASPRWGGGGAGRGRGWGWGCGWGRGRGGRGWGGRQYRHGYGAAELPGRPPGYGYGPGIDANRADAMELTSLKEQAEHFERLLEGLKSRIEELESGQAAPPAPESE